MRLIGNVSEVEKNEVLLINEKIISLKELILSIDDTEMIDEEREQLITRINNDNEKLKRKFSEYWEQLILKYKWTIDEDSKLKLDFNDNQVYIIS